MMDNLIFDCYSIFWQVLLNFFPDGEPITSDFKLTAFIFACILCTFVIWFIFRMIYTLTNAVISVITTSGGAK